jgi:hypothetical protein
MRARGGGLMPASLCVAPTGLCLPSTLLRRYARADISRPYGGSRNSSISQVAM